MPVASRALLSNIALSTDPGGPGSIRRPSPRHVPQSAQQCTQPGLEAAAAARAGDAAPGRRGEAACSRRCRCHHDSCAQQRSEAHYCSHQTPCRKTHSAHPGIRRSPHTLKPSACQTGTQAAQACDRRARRHRATLAERQAAEWIDPRSSAQHSRQQRPLSPAARRASRGRA